MPCLLWIRQYSWFCINFCRNTEVRLLDSERRAMQGRVLELVESERRAAVAAGRRRIEREVADQLAEEQAASLTERQVWAGQSLAYVLPCASSHRTVLLTA